MLLKEKESAYKVYDNVNQIFHLVCNYKLATQFRS